MHRSLQEYAYALSLDLASILSHEMIAGHAKNAYWYGSRLTNEATKILCPHTSLQTVAGVLSGVIWAMRHPQAGIVDPEEMDFREVLDLANPYLGEMVGVFSE